ncbi:MAG: hypothetical protein SGBAC_008362 [Bacillariaceae sp.]
MSAAKGMISVTRTKESADQKVGVELKQDKDGAIFIKKISKNGLFKGNELEVGDKVLSISGKRIEKNQSLEDYVEATLDNENLEKITIVGRKQTAWGKTTPTKGEKKVFKKEFKLDANGIPILYGSEENAKAVDDEEKVQVLCKATKEKEGQAVGVTFVKVGDKLFVSGISAESIFHPSKKQEDGEGVELEFGDRIASVNDTNFMSYADAAYAEKLLNKKSARECTLYVEKGWDILGTGHVDPIHYDPTLARGGKARYAKKEEPEPESDADDSSVEVASKDGSIEEKEPEGSGIAKPDLKAVAPPPKDDEPITDEGMWWDT